jgi:hypothetical protein
MKMNKKKRKNTGYPSFYGKNIAQNVQKRYLRKKKAEEEGTKEGKEEHAP